MKILIKAIVLPDGRALLSIDAGGEDITATCESWDDAQKVISAFIKQHKLTLTKVGMREVELPV